MLLQLDDLPPWRRAILEAKRTAFSTLPPDEQERAKQDQREMRQRALERRQAATRRRRTIVAMLFDGSTTEEVAVAVGRTSRGIRFICSQLGIPLEWRPLARRLFVWISDDRVAALDRAAADYGATRAQTLEDAMVFLLDDDAHALRRELRIKRPEVKS